MANAKWDDLKAKIFFGSLAFFILGLLSWITGEDSPVFLIWNGFWVVVWTIGFFGIFAVIYALWKDRKE